MLLFFFYVFRFQHRPTYFFLTKEQIEAKKISKNCMDLCSVCNHFVFVDTMSKLLDLKVSEFNPNSFKYQIA